MPPGVDLRTIGNIVNAESETMKLLNPELRRGITPPEGEGYAVRVPVGSAAKLLARQDELKSRKHGFFIEHKLSRGETLSHVSRRYGVDVRTIMDLNNIKHAGRLRSGQVLQIPVDYRTRSPSRKNGASWQPETSRRVASTSAARPATYKVRKGDNLTRIAKDLGVDVAELRRVNRITGSQLFVGQTLKIPGAAAARGAPATASRRVASKPNYRIYKVRRGDTLTKISKDFGVSLDEILEHNRVQRGRDLQAGDTLRIPRL